MKPVISWISTCLLAALLAAPAAARAQFAATTELVEVYVTVVDGKGQPVDGLHREQFTVFDDGVARSIEAFTAGEFPLTVAVGVDRSWSMAGTRLDAARAGALKLVQALRSDDQLMALAIGSRVEAVGPLGTSRDSIASALARLDPWGTSPIGDGVTQAIDAIAEGRGRRALVLLTDGEDRYSEQDRSVVLDRVRRADVLVFPIGIGRRLSPLLIELAALSGGRALAARDRTDAERAALTIANELRHQYLIGFAPAAGSHKGWHPLRVDVAQPAVVVRARSGYLLP
jgi:Ca-activated chloride channel family protein